MMDSAQVKTILVIGATGGIGRETARAFLLAGWTVRALARKPEAAAKTFGNLVGVKWLKGDAMQMNDVIRAAEGAAVIFHGANPPDYVKWRELAIPMLANTIESLVRAVRVSSSQPISIFSAPIPGLLFPKPRHSIR